MLVIGLIGNGIATFTFAQATVCTVGCGIYLFYSSLLSSGTLIIYAIKLIFIVLYSRSVIFNHLSCVFIEFLIKCLPECVTWLNVCVSIERLVSIGRGVKFDKNKSVIVARIVVGIIIILNVLTTVILIISLIIIRLLLTSYFSDT